MGWEKVEESKEGGMLEGGVGQEECRTDKA